MQNAEMALTPARKEMKKVECRMKKRLDLPYSAAESAGKPDALQTLRDMDSARKVATHLECVELAPDFCGVTEFFKKL